MHILFGPTQGATGPNGGQGPRGSNGDAVSDFKLHQLWTGKCDDCSSPSSPQGAQGTRGAEGSKGEKGDLGVLGDRGPNGRNGIPAANVSPINHVLWPKFCPHCLMYATYSNTCKCLWQCYSQTLVFDLKNDLQL